MIFRAALVSLFFLGAGPVPPGFAEDSSERPNVLVLLTDDQGWGDLSIHGNTNVETPNLDSIAREGASFENFYVCRVCAPTRAEFLTGRYASRVGVTGVTEGEERLDPEATTVADLFRDAGYATGAFGKWHNGTQSPYHPNDRGFDEFYGYTSGHWSHYFSPPLDHNGRTVRGEGYIVDDCTDRALAFLEENRDRPFFCYVPFATPHSPMMVEDEYYEKFDGVDPGMRFHEPEREDLAMTRAALAMVENIDDNVGRLLGKLEELGIAENTLLLFFCDNGPNSFRWNGGMKGRKGSIDEGGVRSPLFVRWPGTVDPGSEIDAVTGAIDLLPSLCGLAGIEARTTGALDGRSFAPLLRGETLESGDRLLFSRKRNQVSVRTDHYRLDGPGRLYDVASDRGQTRDLSERFPEVAAELAEAARAHLEEMDRERARFADRPFTVGWSERTVLPARDGRPHGGVERSSKAPNCSFFTGWDEPEGAITWEIRVGEPGRFRAIVHYTCPEENLGARLRLGTEQHGATSPGVVEATVEEAFDPPLYDKTKERVAESHYFMKDFRPLELGVLELPAGRRILRLDSPEFPGPGVVDVHSIELWRVE